MVEISDDDFEKTVTEEYHAIPDEMFGELKNVAILVANQPLGERPRLFGL
jgi:predicted Zn-dependent protease with MMP-like domain